MIPLWGVIYTYRVYPVIGTLLSPISGIFPFACLLYTSYLDLEVVITGGVVALRYLVDGFHGIHELLNQVMGMLLEPDIAEHDYVCLLYTSLRWAREGCR